MARKTRTILFLTLFAFFLVLASFFITFAQGYRIDIEKMRLTKTGGLYVKSIQGEIDVYLNGKFKGNLGQIFKNLLLQNLLPKTYEITLKKNGYFPWTKNLEVREGLVTEIKNAYLFPELNEPGEELLATEIESIFNFAFDENGKKIVIARNTDDALAPKKEIIVSDLYFTNPLKFSDGLEDIRGFQWSDDSRGILIENKGAPGNATWFLINTEKANPKVEQIFSLKNAKKIIWQPNSSRFLFAGFSVDASSLGKLGTSSLYLYKYDVETKKFLIVLPEMKVKNFSVNKNNLFWLDGSGILWKGNFEGKNGEKLNAEPLPEFNQKKEYQLFISDFGDIGIIENDEILYFFNKESKVFEKIASGIAVMEFFDQSKVFYYGTEGIYALFLEDYSSQPQRKKGDVEFIAKFPEGISYLQLFQKTLEHLIVKTGNQIKIAELDNRDKINIIDLANADGNIYYNNFDKKLYILNEGKLYKIKL